MKKFFKGILIFILIIVLLAGGILAFVYFSIKDDTDNTPASIKENAYSNQYVLSREIADSFSGDSEDISIALNGREINEIIYGIVKDINIPSLTFKGAYSYFDDDNDLNIELPLNINNMIDTNVKLKLELERDNVYHYFQMSVMEGKVGSLSVTNAIIKWGLSQFKVEEEIEKALTSNGIECDVNLKNFSFKITDEQILNLISTKLKDDENLNLYSMLAELCLLNTNLVEFKFNQSKYFSFVIKASNMKYVSSRDGTIDYPIDYDSIMTIMKQDLNTKINYENVNSVYNYYVVGYDNLEEADKEVISSLGYDTTYGGIRTSSYSTMKDVILNQEPSSTQIAKALLQGKYEVKVNENQFNAIFASRDFIGKSIAFASTQNIGYLSIESLYIDIGDDSFKLNIVLNINGRRVILSALFQTPVSSSFTIDATLFHLILGSIDIDTKYFPSILTYLQGVLEDEDWINIDPTNNKIQMNLEKIISSSSIFSGTTFTNYISSKELSFKDNTSNGGELVLTYNLHS